MTGGRTHAAYDPALESQPDEKVEQERRLAESFERSAVVPSALRRSYDSGAPLSASEALIAKNLHLGAIKTLSDQFGGKVVDVSDNSVIVELTAKSTRVDAFLKLVRPFGVLEAARSGGCWCGRWRRDFMLSRFLSPGTMVMPRTPISRSTYDDDDDVPAEVQEFDASLLPPG